MARHYSDHFHATGVVSTLAGTLPLDRSVKIDQGRGGANHKVKRMRINVGTAAAIGDELRLGSFKSGARLHELFVTSDGGATAGAMDIGLYKTGVAGDGVVIDADLFASALDIATAIARVDQFKESAILGDGDRGKMLWELADKGAATLTADPVEQWDLVATVTTAFTVAVTDIVIEAYYTDGD